MQQLDLAGFTAPGSSSVHRLFFALWPDDAIRRCIADAAATLKADHAPAGRWIGAHRYHMTLQFLGDFAQLPASLVDHACAAAAAVHTPAFALTLDRAGSFRNRAIPWWLGCQSAPAGLQQLWDELGRALAKRGVRVPSGALTPHVTILRNADRALPPSTAIAPIEWPVASFALIHSELGARNAYTVLQEWPLANERGNGPR